jgi:hypothetical protein
VLIKKNIVLRDVPKDEIQIDLWPFKVSGGFRGFSEVLSGPHFLTVKDKGQKVDEWFFIKTKTLVKRYDEEAMRFINSENDSEFNYANMADSGLMLNNLIVYPNQAAMQWQALTSFVTEDNFDSIRIRPSMDAIENNTSELLLAQYQMSYVRMIVQPLENRNEEDWNNWGLWLRFFYGFSSHQILENKHLFLLVIDLFIMQFNILPKAYRKDIDFIEKQGFDFIQKIEKTQEKDLILKANHYKYFLF